MTPEPNQINGEVNLFDRQARSGIPNLGVYLFLRRMYAISSKSTK